MKKITLLYISIILIAACKKEKITTADDSQYIMAQFGNENLHYSILENDDVYNAYHYAYDSTGFLKLDQLGLMSNSIDNKRGIHFFIMNSKFRSLEFPINLGIKENALVELILYKYNSPADTTFGINDDWNFFGLIDNFLVEEYDNQGYIKGTFDGTIATKTGRSMDVSKGSFRIKIEEKEVEHMEQ